MHPHLIRLHVPEVMLSLEKAPAGGTTALYRFYDSRGALLYVGVSDNFLKRCSQHRLRSPWWFDTQYLSLEWFQARAEAFKAEAAAIKDELPWHNERLNPRENRSLYARPEQ